jgi:hypothetical protein
VVRKGCIGQRIGQHALCTGALRVGLLEVVSAMYSVTCYVRHYSHIERARDKQLSAETRLGIYGAPCRARWISLCCREPGAQAATVTVSS